MGRSSRTRFYSIANLPDERDMNSNRFHKFLHFLTNMKLVQRLRLSSRSEDTDSDRHQKKSRVVGQRWSYSQECEPKRRRLSDSEFKVGKIKAWQGSNSEDVFVSKLADVSIEDGNEAFDLISV